MRDTRGFRFFRFASSSLTCTLVDQLVAWFLFALLRDAFPPASLMRIVMANTCARCVSIALNYSINQKLVFSFDGASPQLSRKSSIERYLFVAASILALSTLGVWTMHTLYGTPEWIAKPFVDFMLFFLNYKLQRGWVFRAQERAIA